MYQCQVCNFTSWNRLEVEGHGAHCHPSCNTCKRMFYDDLAKRQHYVNSSRHNYCAICTLDFRSPAARRQHYLDSVRHNYCGICEREFSSPRELRAHQQTHMAKDIECPRCDESFTSASALVKHVEAGKCFELTHGQIVDKVREWEIRSEHPYLVTKPRLGNGTPGPIQATSAAYKCSFCPREFRLLVSLNQHLRSGIHLPEEFRCAICGYTANWLSSLIQHFESEQCNFMTFSEVKNLATTSIAKLRSGN